MESSIFFGGSILAAVVAGSLALFAPCCISFMLPAYFASSFQNRLRLVAMTFLFAGGVVTVILPIALGASVLRQFLTTQHATIYVVGGMLLFGLAFYLLLGGQVHLPMPGRRAGGKAGVASVYSLGVFSGITSSCCAPVLAGVVALSSVASSFVLALLLGIAYGRVGSGCPSQDHPSPSLRTGHARFPSIRLALYLSFAVFSIRKFPCMQEVVTVQAEDKRFPVSGCHHLLPCCFTLRNILHFPNVMNFKRSTGCLTVFALARVQSFDKLRSIESKHENIGRCVYFCVVGCYRFKVLELKHSDDSRLFLPLHGEN